MQKQMQTMTATQLKEKREKLGLSQDELSRMLGYHHRSSVSRLENGERIITPRIEMAVKTIIDAYYHRAKPKGEQKDDKAT
jgi:transcriptional regulator with XRE-family HTH domain